MKIAKRMIRIYQRSLSLMLGKRCRFEPTCSQYSIEAITNFGLLKGLLLTIKRLSKCHIFHPGGYDPTPKKNNRTAR